MKKKTRSSPRSSGGNGGNGHGTTSSSGPNPHSAASSASSSTVSSAASHNSHTNNIINSNSNRTTSSVIQDHDSLKVETFDDLIRSDVDAMMNASSDTSTNAPQWVGSIDQGTSSTRFMIFNNAGLVIASAQMEHEQIYPQPSWHEHDPIQIWKNTITCMTTVARTIQSVLSNAQNDFLFHPPTPTSSTISTPTDADAGTAGTAGTTGTSTRTSTTASTTEAFTSTSTAATSHFLSAIGVTNQRETIVCWNRNTGRPYYNAIVWDDARTCDIVNDIQTNATPEELHYLTQTTGLPISTYFAATKMKWLLNHVEQIRYDLQHQNEQVCFGTIDTWLLYQLTGQVPKSEKTHRPLKGHAGLCNTGGIYKTDVTNASRWLFMNLQRCQWEERCISIICGPTLNQFIQITHNLPEICPSSYLFGHVNVHCGIPSTMYGNIPITGILGDQQAALFGQAAHTKGCAKNTYGTGLFLMMNTGPDVVPPMSTHGLLTTVAYRIGMDGPIYYAYEGSVSHSGSTIQWLRDQIGIIKDASESEVLARTTSNNDGLYMVPAFGGLLAPHWRNDARGCIVGITALHHKGHICRAALEATAYQTKDVFDAIIKDSNITLSSLNVDGGGTYNKLLMQFQADILNVKVVRPKVMETTSIGVAFAAGLTIGIWKDVTEIQQLWSMDTVYEPQMSEVTRQKYISGWNKALSKSFNWTTPHSTDDVMTTEVTIDTAEVHERHDTTVSTVHENDLGSSWMVVPSSALISSSSTPAATDPDVVTTTDNKEIPVDTGNETKLSIPVVPETSAVVDVVLPTIDEESKVPSNMDNAEIVPPDQNNVIESKTSLPVSEGFVDCPTNTVTPTTSHSEQKSGYDLFTFISAVGLAFTAGMLVTRKR